ncbi:single-stranded DNA-binding protein [Bifidobacterium sp. DSM 109958]|uniref:Single-stranded DNA-binding protein n=1 Tax=Bifidobacterium moraviense TaxID=2675323 RepID=A0A7Y0HZ74_9BIFI|nr:single-stranded DNA-binding protein [Bifidobacterium sp. DSM 109958]NMN01147.1 single-stranded DNA-binding protein [Bifidobacterium sp. DSM 109958]
MAAQQGIVTVNGYLGSDPIRIGQSSTPVSVFTMATTPGFRNQQTGQWVDMPTTWLRIKAFRALAANVLASLHKGDPVIVTGQIGTEQWNGKDGTMQSSMVITATNIGHDLNTGWTRFTKTPTRRDGDPVAGVAGTAGAAPGPMPFAANDPHAPQQNQFAGQPQNMMQQAGPSQPQSAASQQIADPSAAAAVAAAAAVPAPEGHDAY